MNKKIITEIFEIFKQNNPNPATELIYKNPFELLVAVVLSAQATDVGVNKATKELFKIANTPQHILSLGIERLESYIKSIGLYKTKAKNIMGLSKTLIEKYNSRVPETFDELLELNGVGRKTANVILNTLHGHSLVAVDTHVFRVSNRIGIAVGKTPLEVEKSLLSNVPKQYLQNAHHWLILHGRYVCKARNPACGTCIINKYCNYYKDSCHSRVRGNPV